MRSKRSHEGYLLIDHSNAPGAGTIPSGRKFESATITCSHCHRVVILNPDRSRPRNHCRACDHYICDVCAASPAECRPLNAVFDRIQERVAKDIDAGRMTPGGVLVP